MKLTVALLISSALLWSVGCGGDDGALECGTAACGGDPVGTWTIADVCVTGGDFVAPDECPEATGSNAFELSGTITFNDDETYEANVTSLVTGDFTIPASCLEGLPITSCADLEQDEDTTCEGTPDTECSCSFTIENVDTDPGTWSTTGNQLDLDGEGAGDYCVDGDAMSLHAPDDPDSDFGLEIQLVR